MSADFLYWLWMLQHHCSTAVFASDEEISFHLHLFLVIGRSVICLLRKKHPATSDFQNWGFSHNNLFSTQAVHYFT